MKKILICLILLFSASQISINASTNEEDDYIFGNKLPVITQEEFEYTLPENLPNTFILSPGLLRSNEHAVYTKIGNAFSVDEADVGIHPQLTTPRKANGYYFSASRSLSYSANIGYGVFSFGISASSTSGWFITCDGSRYSKVGMKPSFSVQKYKVTRIDNYTGNVLGTSETYGHVLTKEYNYCVY